MNSIKVRVPATTANLGPGFDVLGLALGLYNEVELAVADETSVEIEGEGADTLPRDERHLVLHSANALVKETGDSVSGWRLRQVNRIPLARGLGSSSAAIVGGIVAANALLETDVPLHRLLDLAAAIEGHPDNVAPALSGGLTATWAGEELRSLRLDPPPLQVVLAIPDFEIKTADARKVLPDVVSRSDAVFNVAHVALTMAAFVRGSYGMLRMTMQDRLHQPYRAHLVPGFDQVVQRAIGQLAYGAWLSGSGPTVAAFAQRDDAEAAIAIAAAMCQAFREAGVQCKTLVVPVDAHGAQIV